MMIGRTPNPLTPMAVLMPEQPQASSSVTRHSSNRLSPNPPYCSGTAIVVRPSFCASRMMGQGYSWVLS